MITKSEREWIEGQLKVNGLTGEAARKFTTESVDYFTKLHSRPRKQDFATINFAEIVPNMPEHLKLRRIK